MQEICERINVELDKQGVDVRSQGRRKTLKIRVSERESIECDIQRKVVGLDDCEYRGSGR